MLDASALARPEGPIRENLPVGSADGAGLDAEQERRGTDYPAIPRGSCDASRPLTREILEAFDELLRKEQRWAESLDLAVCGDEVFNGWLAPAPILPSTSRQRRSIRRRMLRGEYVSSREHATLRHHSRSKLVPGFECEP